MSVLSQLERAGVWCLSDPRPIGWEEVSYKGAKTYPVSPVLTSSAQPGVSCVMLTRGNIEIMRYSLACFRRQTYPHRELVVVSEPEAGDKVRAFINSQEGLNAAVFVAPPGLTVGDRRNLAAARATGDIIVTWDDDDLSDPERLNISIQALRRSGAAAAFLSRLLIWWPQRETAAISQSRLWEQTISVWRPFTPIYAPLRRGGDTAAIDRLTTTSRIARVDCPLMYVYTVTGGNLWNASHFHQLISNSDCVFRGDQFHELNQLLSDRLPTLEYSAVLTHRGQQLAIDGDIE